MAHTQLKMEDSRGRIRHCYIGFSGISFLAALFFAGWIIPLLRGQWGTFIVTLVLTSLTAGAYGLIYPFFDHALYRTFLYNNGFRLIGIDGKLSLDEVLEVTGWEANDDLLGNVYGLQPLGGQLKGGGSLEQRLATWCNGQRPSGNRMTKCGAQLFRCNRCGSTGCDTGAHRPCSNASFKNSQCMSCGNGTKSPA